MLDEDENSILDSDDVRSRVRGSVNQADDDVALLDPTAEPRDTDVVCRHFNRQNSVQLTYTELQSLAKSLQETTSVLAPYLEDIQYMERRAVKHKTGQSRCPTLKSLWSRTLRSITGAKGISTTILLQLVCLVMLTLVDSLPRNPDEKRLALLWGSIMMMVLQTVNLIIVLLISVQLAKQIKRRRISRLLFVQSYLATILVFAGIYTATYRIASKSWKFVSDPDGTTDPVMIVYLYTRFLFFSVSTATLCGSADALPKDWYTCIFVSVQMLLSFMYFTSVLGTVLRPKPEPELKDSYLILPKNSQRRNERLDRNKNYT